MRRMAGAAVAATILGGAVEAWARTVTVPARDPSPAIVTRPTLVSRSDVVRVRVKVPYPDTRVRFRVYPQTYGYRPTSTSCSGRFPSAWRRTDAQGRVTIRLDPSRPLCKGVLYQAETLIGSGEVPDKFAHLCVRGRPADGTAACEDSLG